MIMKIAAMVRGVTADLFPERDEDKQLVMNPRGDQVVAQSLPALTELVRLGDSWQCKTTTPFAALTTEPTTTAALSLTNNEAAGGKVYAIDSIVLYERVVDTTQQNQAAIFAMVTPARGTAPSAGTVLANATVIKSLSGRTAYDGNAIVRAGGTVVDDGWFPLGNSVAGAAAVAGGAWRVTDIPVRGLYHLIPGSSLNLHVAKIAATASQCNMVIRFHQVRLPVAT